MASSKKFWPLNYFDIWQHNYFLYSHDVAIDFKVIVHASHSWGLKGFKIYSFLVVCLSLKLSTLMNLQRQMPASINSHTQDLIINLPYYLPYSSYDVSLENFESDQLTIHLWLFFSLFSSIVYLILHWCCKKKFSHGYSWELKGET